MSQLGADAHQAVCLGPVTASVRTSTAPRCAKTTLLQHFQRTLDHMHVAKHRNMRILTRSTLSCSACRDYFAAGLQQVGRPSS